MSEQKIEPAEFDDAVRNGPFVSSPMARAEMGRLAAKHGLSFTHNPGGGEFGRRGWRCQISTNDDIADLATLREGIQSLPPEKE